MIPVHLHLVVASGHDPDDRTVEFAAMPRVGENVDVGTLRGIIGGITWKSDGIALATVWTYADDARHWPIGYKGRRS